MEDLGRTYRFGKRLGDHFTHRYHALPPAKRARWDDRRLMHHGLVGFLVASFALSGYASSRSAVGRWIYGATLALGLGLMESDLHDHEAWFTEGRVVRRVARTPALRE